MSSESKDVWAALKVLGMEGARVNATAEGLACLSQGAPFFRDHGTVNRHSWRKMLREGWVEFAPQEFGPSDAFEVYRISEKGRRRLDAL